MASERVIKIDLNKIRLSLLTKLLLMKIVFFFRPDNLLKLMFEHFIPLFIWSSMKFLEECKNVWRENAAKYFYRTNKTGRDIKIFFETVRNLNDI